MKQVSLDRPQHPRQLPLLAHAHPAAADRHQTHMLRPCPIFERAVGIHYDEKFIVRTRCHQTVQEFIHVASYAMHAARANHPGIDRDAHPAPWD